MGWLRSFLSGAARVLDLSGTPDLPDLPEAFKTPPRRLTSHTDDWAALCEDGRQIREDFARAWETTKGSSNDTATPKAGRRSP